MSCTDLMLLDDWHVIAEVALLSLGEVSFTRLFEEVIEIDTDLDGVSVAKLRTTGRELPTNIVYGFLWTCLGTPAGDVIHVPEALDTQRFHTTGGPIGVKVSGLRVVENFVDMGHFPFIHNGWLGEAPHTEVAPYDVEVTEDDEIIATGCHFFQPVSSPSAKGGLDVKYIYRIYRPYVVGLYKTNPARMDRPRYQDTADYIVLFIQPVGPESCIIHSQLCYFKEDMDEFTLRWFFHVIFGQDKPILENQLPKRLPLDPQAETPIRADHLAIAYRRWLQDHAITYGAIPAQ